MSRGYLHGGLFIDFIGQKGPISKLRLITFDILVIVLQIVMMAVMLEKERTHAALPGEPATSSEASSSSGSSSSTQAQDLDSEERGVHRLQEITDPNDDDIELHEMHPAGPLNDTSPDESGGERSGLLSDPLAESRDRLDRADHPRDEYLTGEVVIMDMDFAKTLREQWRRNSGTTGSSGSSSATEAGISPRIYFRRRFGVHFGANF